MPTPTSNLQPIVAVFEIKAYPKDKQGYLVDITDYLNGDNDVLFFYPRFKRELHLGGLQADKSYIESVRSFAKNTEIRTVKTYQRAAAQGPGGAGGGENEGSSFIIFELNTSLVELPEHPMQARYADKRIGYFSVGYTDFDLNPQGTEDVTFIKRWRLEPEPADREKYDRGELVEPAQPIIYYIDPATPAKWVPYLIRGVTDWNKAFEKAGFKNAVLTREAPKNDTTCGIPGCVLGPKDSWTMTPGIKAKTLGMMR